MNLNYHSTILKFRDSTPLVREYINQNVGSKFLKELKALTGRTTDVVVLITTTFDDIVTTIIGDCPYGTVISYSHYDRSVCSLGNLVTL